MNDMDTEMLEEEFEYKMVDLFDKRYHSDTDITLLDEEEYSEDNLEKFKEYLRIVAEDMSNPMYDGVFIRLMYRDFIYNTMRETDD